METSFVNSVTSTSKAIASLFVEDNTGIQLEELDEYDIMLLALLSKALILDNRKLLSTIKEDLLLQTLKNYTTELFVDAVEGLAIIVKQNNLTSLKALDQWLEKEEERCLGFLKDAKPTRTPSSY